MKDKYKLLVVNRNEELTGKLEENNEAGFYIEAAQTAALAIEKVKNDKYHIILIDTDIPDKDGIELLKEIKNYDPLAQIIMTTNQSTMEKILSSLEYGANDYITDPMLNLEELKNMIDYSIEKLERWRKSIIDLVNNIIL